MNSILIVEDERIVAKDLQQTLAGMGYDAFAIAASADEALRYASERCPDLVLMDIRIKGKRDGIETAALLHDRFALPVVYLTAHADEATLDRAKQTEPYGYLMKPVRPAELRSMIEISIHRHRMDLRHRRRARSSTETLQSTADAVISVDLSGSISFMNPAAEKLAGVAAAEAVGRPVDELIRRFDPPPPASPRAPDPGATPDRAADGAGHDTTSAMIEDGRTTGAILVLRDIPTRRHGHTQLELAARLTSLGTLAAGLAHEVNNPLAIVVANASYVLEELKDRQRLGDHSGRVGEAIRAQVDLEAAAIRIGRIVAELQTFSRPAQSTIGETEVGPAIEAAVRATAHEFRDRANVVTNLPGLPRARIDELRLGQILVNLLVNAAHATPSGPHASVSVTARAQDDTVVIEVRDTGCGMVPDVSKRIFEPFYTTKGVGLGLGLGLAVCHGIVRSVGGRIEVESQRGVGSTFRVTLPAVVPAEAPAEAIVASLAPPRRGRLLVVDDEPMLLKVMTRILRDHEVVCLDDARLVSGLLDRGEKFDLIFSDLMMPNMSGTDLYEHLLVRHPSDAARIVFVTGGVVSGQVADFLSVVPNTCLEKPVSADTLRALVRDRITGNAPVPRAPDPRS